MKQVISAWVFLFSLNAFSCEINQTRDVISLSGPITHLLFELKLLKTPVMAISEFHGINPKDFSGKILKGGMFLSPQVLKTLKNPLIFFDESLEQRKTIKRLDIQGIELKTKNLDPFEVYHLSKDKLSPYLKNCETELSLLQKKVDGVKLEVEKSKKLNGYYFFYLGEIKKDERKPNLIMIDNFVLTFLKNKLLETYPSQLNYVPWSEKVVHDYQKKKTFFIGLVTSSQSEKRSLELKQVSEREFNFYHPALLVPGLAQINFLKELVSKLPQ